MAEGDGSDEAARVRALFTREDGGFRFARWAKPLAPAAFGADAETAELLREGLGAAAGLAGIGLAEEDPELGANVITFLGERWEDFDAIPRLDALAPDFARLKPTLKAVGANQYRWFHFEPGGAIRLCVALLTPDESWSGADARGIALTEGAQTVLLWSERAFLGASPVAMAGGRAVLEPWRADLVRAAYDPALPDASTNPALAERIALGMRALREARS